MTSYSCEIVEGAQLPRLQRAWFIVNNRDTRDLKELSKIGSHLSLVKAPFSTSKAWGFLELRRPTKL